MRSVTDPLLTIPEAADRLRFTADWVYRLTSRGELAPVVRLGRRVLVPESTVDGYIAEHTTTPRKSRKGAAA